MGIFTGDMFHDAEGDFDLPESPEGSSGQTPLSSQSSLREPSIARSSAVRSRSTRAGSHVSMAENSSENTELSQTTEYEQLKNNPYCNENIWILVV